MRKPGAKAFLVYRGKLLLILRDNNPDIPAPNTWNLPGGDLDEDEDPESAIKRELREELSIFPSLNYLGKQVYPDGSLVYRYFSELTMPPVKNIALGEGQGLGFFDLEELKEINLTPYMKAYFDQVEPKLQLLPDKKGRIDPKELGLE